MRLLIAVLVATIGVAAHAEIFQWTDADGNVHMSDHPPTDAHAKVEKKTVTVPTTTSEQHRESANARQREDAALNDLNKQREEKQQAAQKAADDAQANEDKTHRCSQLKARMAMLSSGRIVTYDANGDHHYDSDDEIKQKQQEVSSEMQSLGCD